MNNIYFNEAKIKIYAQIQSNLIKLGLDATNQQYDDFFSRIPSYILDSKDDLKILCRLFAIYSRKQNPQYKRIGIKLFEKIMKPIKKYLYDDSNFFWCIFGDITYYKLWFYQEGLISIDDIVLNSLADKSSNNANYFLSEIIENRPEIYEKEIKNKKNVNNSSENLKKLKKNRAKLFKWLCESGDYLDPKYLEIQKSKLLLSLKTDNVDLFQQVISRQNLSIDEEIKENLIENYFIDFKEYPIIVYAAEYNSVNILKYLILNDANTDEKVISPFISSKNYEMFHYFESKNEFSPLKLFCSAIFVWNDEMIEYLIDNYDFDFLYKNEVNSENVSNIITIINNSIYALNFTFIESKIIPFLKKNPTFIDDNINDILFYSISDHSCFFTKELLKHPKIDYDYMNDDDNLSFLSQAIIERNYDAIDLFLNIPDIDINKPVKTGFSTFQLACGKYIDNRIITKFCTNPKVDINFVHRRHNVNVFQLTVSRGNPYALECLIKNHPEIETGKFNTLYFYCLDNNHLLTLKILVQFFLKKNKNITTDQMIDYVKEKFAHRINYKEEYCDVFRNIINEVRLITVRPPQFPNESIRKRIKKAKDRPIKPTIIVPKVQKK